MSKTGTVLLLMLTLAAALTMHGAEPPRGKWSCVALTPRHLALTGDYLEVQRRIFAELNEKARKTGKRLPKWAKDLRFHLRGAEAIAAYRPLVARMFRHRPAVGIESPAGPLGIVGTGYWLNPIGQSRFKDETGKMRFSQNADVAHYLFLTLDRPLADAEKIAITLPAGEKIDFTYRANAPSPLFKINQVGYMPEAVKYAYVGAWLGNAGPMPMHKEFAGKKFALVDSQSGREVFSGLLHPRLHDPVNSGGTPFTGEEVLEMDFSRFRTPGRYHLAVEGLGRSFDFRIGDDTMAEAFYIHMRGLYHQRCGIAKEKPYTNWTMPVCHKTCVRGVHPPAIGHYSRGDRKRAYGFHSSDGDSLRVSHFALIKQNAPKPAETLAAPGGWHDAGDWDRRPQHLEIVGDLTAVYLMRPENFSDGQLNIPESGNGIPDILDEARWGLEHLRLSQRPDGGVGTWIETTRHPSPKDGGSFDDRLTYYISCPTRGSTLEYAAYAAELALALKRAGAKGPAEQFRDSAVKAWNFALDPKNRAVRTYRYDRKIIFYREKPKLASEFLVKAGYSLFRLTGDRKYISAAAAAAPEAMKSMRQNSWHWSPFFWIELELFPPESLELEKLRSARRFSLIKKADKMLEEQERNYPIRIAWYDAREAWVHTMGWGTFHPLNRARGLVMAHALTDDRKYLDGAYIANDFHNGANPSGSSMTSGLGRVYPVRFLDLNSYANGFAEPVPGITPYRNTYGIPRAAIKLAYGLFYKAKPKQDFPGISISLMPEEGLNEKDCLKEVGKMLPIWRRWGNVECITVAASEYTVWETISPAAAVTGYLLTRALPPKPEWIARRPAADIRELPGYAPLP